MKTTRKIPRKVFPWPGNRAGFTLVEVLVALAILAIGMLAVTALQVSAAKSNGSARGITEASTIAARQMERLLNLPFDDGLLIDKNTANGLDATGDDADHRPADAGGLYNICWNVQDNQVLDNSKTIQVVVSFQYLGQDRRIELQRVKVRN